MPTSCFLFVPLLALCACAQAPRSERVIEPGWMLELGEHMLPVKVEQQQNGQILANAQLGARVIELGQPRDVAISFPAGSESLDMAMLDIGGRAHHLYPGVKCAHAEGCAPLKSGFLPAAAVLFLPNGTLAQLKAKPGYQARWHRTR